MYFFLTIIYSDIYYHTGTYITSQLPTHFLDRTTKPCFLSNQDLWTFHFFSFQYNCNHASVQWMVWKWFLSHFWYHKTDRRYWNIYSFSAHILKMYAYWLWLLGDEVVYMKLNHYDPYFFQVEILASRSFTISPDCP